MGKDTSPIPVDQEEFDKHKKKSSEEFSEIKSEVKSYASKTDKIDTTVVDLSKQSDNLSGRVDNIEAKLKNLEDTFGKVLGRVIGLFRKIGDSFRWTRGEIAELNKDVDELYKG